MHNLKRNKNFPFWDVGWCRTFCNRNHLKLLFKNLFPFFFPYFFVTFLLFYFFVFNFSFVSLFLAFIFFFCSLLFIFFFSCCLSRACKFGKSNPQDDQREIAKMHHLSKHGHDGERTKKARCF